MAWLSVYRSVPVTLCHRPSYTTAQCKSLLLPNPELAAWLSDRHTTALVGALGLKHFQFNSLNMQIETLIHLLRDKSATLPQ